MTDEEHICTVEEVAALKFAAVDDGPHKMPDLETWLQRKKDEYVVLALCLPVLNFSDVDLDRKLRSNDDPEAIIRGLQELTENAISLHEEYRDAARVMESVFVRLLAVLARFADTEPLAGRAS